MHSGNKLRTLAIWIALLLVPLLGFELYLRSRRRVAA